MEAFRDHLRRLRAPLALSFFVAACAAQAQDVPPMPDLLWVKTPGPGTYAGYLDFAKKQVWQYENVPQPIVQEAAVCMAGVVYDFATPAERAELDEAARGNGFDPMEYSVFSQMFIGRAMGDGHTDERAKVCERQNEAMSRALNAR
jgi:hypothetical protein